MREERDHLQQMMMEMEKLRMETMETRIQATRAEAEAEKAAVRAQAAAQMREAQLMQEVELVKARLPKVVGDLISEPQLEAFRRRLEGIRSAKLLSDEAAYSLEDCVADYIELMPDAPATAADVVTQVTKMVKLSEKICDDPPFARQLLRKFVR